MFCCLSGRIAVHPLVSRKSGRVFERDVLYAWLTEKETDPVSGDPASREDYVAIAAPQPNPRERELVSVPSLLGALQTEFNATILESHVLRQQLLETQKELSTALYRVDAATRVVSRLKQERDDARHALEELDLLKLPHPSNDAMPASESSQLERKRPNRSAKAMADPEQKSRKKRKNNPIMQDESWRHRLEVKHSELVATHRQGNAEYAENFDPEPQQPVVKWTLQGTTINVTDTRVMVQKGDLFEAWTKDSHGAPLKRKVINGVALLTGPNTPYVSATRRLFANVTSRKSVVQLAPGFKQVVEFPLGFAVNYGTYIDIISGMEGEGNLMDRIEIDYEIVEIQIHVDADLIVLATSDRVIYWSLLKQAVMLEVLQDAPEKLVISATGYFVGWISHGRLFIHDLRTDDDPEELARDIKQAKFDVSGRKLAAIGTTKVYWWLYSPVSRKLEQKPSIQDELKSQIHDLAWGCDNQLYAAV